MSNNSNIAQLLVAKFCLNGTVYIPQDILLIIVAFYSFHDIDLNLHLILDFQFSVNNAMANIMDVFTNKHWLNKIDHLQYDKIECIPNFEIVYKFIDHHILPTNLYNVLNIPSLSNDEWTLFLQRSTNSRRIFDDHELGLNTMIKMDDNSYKLYYVKLPYHDHDNRFVTIPVYDKRRNKLYSLDTFSHIWSLDLNDNNGYDNWKWNVLSKNIKTQRERVSACMIDNDQFIGILGGVSPLKRTPMKRFEIYAMNANQCIRLKDSYQCPFDGISLYHDKYHKIILGGNERTGKCIDIEWYDINKDIWEIIANQDGNSSMKDIWISCMNPNILFSTTCSKRNQNVYIRRLDMRVNDSNQMLKPIWSTDFITQQEKNTRCKMSYRIGVAHLILS